MYILLHIPTASQVNPDHKSFYHNGQCHKERNRLALISQVECMALTVRKTNRMSYNLWCRWQALFFTACLCHVFTDSQTSLT